jgi:methylated-DNA-[protein]-cysteine S-methyltransferase
MQWIAPAGPPPETVWDVFKSPLGPLTLRATARGLRSVSFPRRREERPEKSDRNPTVLAPVTRQLEEYFAGERRRFDLELDIAGEPLAVRVWNELRKIPYGATTTYGALGEAVGHANAREIGSLVGSTPAPIVIPCHRVIGTDGSLRGYGGGLDRKKALLLLEHGRRGRREPFPAWAHEQLGLL